MKEQEKRQLKYQMVLNSIKNLLLIKDILKALPSTDINNYIKIRKDSILEKQIDKIEKYKIVLEEVPPVLYYRT